MKNITLRIKKEIDHRNEFIILKLKGKLISKGFTEIIHIADENDEYYLNSFTISSNNKSETEDFLINYISLHNLTDTVQVLKPLK